MNKSNKILIIAGPCSAENKSQMSASIREAKKRNIDFLRICLWKPRTQPGFEGVGTKGLSLLIDALQAGINPALEVLLPEHVNTILSIIHHVPKNRNILLWIGARNQNHFIQREIARLASQDARILLMLKNQPWQSAKHWVGISRYALSGGIPKNRLFYCHRGFSALKPNPYGFRNVPNFSMAMTIKRKTGIPMIFDPSHVGGSIENVFSAAKIASSYAFDGFMIEVHPTPKKAKTDQQQQLTWKQFDKLLQVIHRSTLFDKHYDA